MVYFIKLGIHAEFKNFDEYEYIYCKINQSVGFVNDYGWLEIQDKVGLIW
jgi:hypothetical protein